MKNNHAIASGEIEAALAFSRQAPLFDALYGNDGMILYKRKRVYAHLEKQLRPSSNILELNAGTGTDAVYLAGKGHTITATDISAQMLEQIKQKTTKTLLEKQVRTERCSFTEIANVLQGKKYDHIFSNFAGLNCTSALTAVLNSFKDLLNDQGRITLVLLPKCCIWELLLVFRGKFRTAFRRFSGKKGAKAHVEGVQFRCWYYNPSFVKKCLRPDFECLELEGLCTMVPPSYIQHFDKKYPRLFRWLAAAENLVRHRWPFRTTGDYYIISFEKKESA